MTATPPERCANCRYFHRSEESQRYQGQHPELQVHGHCRRYAPQDNAQGEPSVVYHPDTPENRQQAIELARELRANSSGPIVALPAPRWSLEHATNRSVSPSHWCGDWAAQEPRCEVRVYADWLDDHGHAEAAEMLRRLER